jgi:tRNA 2-thiouridine synthesizing protein D
MRFALLIRGDAPRAGGSLALSFAREALAQGHRIDQVFFQGDGAYLANRLTAPPAPEQGLVGAWSLLAAEHGVSLVLCSSAGLRRGVREANLAPGFRISGVGQWLEAALAADRVLVFGQ